MSGGSRAALVCAAAIGLTVTVPGFVILWSLLGVVGLTMLSVRHRLGWLREECPSGSRVGPLPTNAARVTALLLLVALAVQVAQWVGDGGRVSSKPGDDDEAYVFLAYQILGYFDAPPVFAFRTPGWPMMIAGLLEVAGGDRIWIVGLYHRVLLATIPPVLFLALARFVRPWVAVAAALLSLAMPYNDRLPTLALTDLSYASLSLFALIALVAALHARRPPRWLVLAGVLLAAKTLVRITGVAIAAGLAVAVLLLSAGPWSRRLGRAALVIAPSLAALLMVSVYNGVVAGQFRPSMGGSIFFLGGIGPHLSRTPDTPAIRELAALVPEVPREHFLQVGGTSWLAHYRLTASGRGDSFDFGAVGDRAVLEVLSAIPYEYAWKATRIFLIGLAFPKPQWAPAGWVGSPRDAYHARIHDATAACALQYPLGAAFASAWCAQNDRLRASLKFQPEWMVGRKALQRITHDLIRGMTGPIQSWIWPLHWGFAAMASVAYLLARRSTRAAGLLIALPLGLDLAFVVLVSFSVGGRYFVHVHVLYIVAIFLGLASAIDALARRSDGRIANRGPVHV